MDQYKNFVRFFQEKELVFAIIVLLVCILAGISISKLVFSRLRSVTARVSGNFYPQLHRALRGMPALWGALVGGYAAILIQGAVRLARLRSAVEPHVA